MKKLGIYIHIPFCVKKCNYCAFLSFPFDEQLKNNYIESLKREIGLYHNDEYLVDTVFFGGGTPSLLEPKEIGDILFSLRESFTLAADGEITIEANPATLDYGKLKGFREVGINRLSMGVQSLNDDVLKYMGRVHTKEDVYREYELARRAGFNNVNIDLMFSVPNDNIVNVKRTLAKVIKLKPEHISYYGLQLEEGTPFFEKFKKGLLWENDDYMDRRMYHEGSRMLINKGYNRYEISNFSKPGYECKHNLKYWNMDEYLGFGLDASSLYKGYRFKNTKDINKYFKLTDDGIKPVEEEILNTEKDNISEAMFTGLRRKEGISMVDIFGSEEGFWEYYKDVQDAIIDYEINGFLNISDGRIWLTEGGIDISNKIMANFV